MGEKKFKYEGIPCPQKGCDTVFTGTKLQIANNLKKHYLCTHLKFNEKVCFDEKKIREKVAQIDSINNEIERNQVFDILVEAFNEICNYNEPEASYYDELVIGHGVDQKCISSCYDLHDYLNDKLLCREERQFALFFANKLSANDEVLIKILRDSGFLEKDERIVEVFFEVSIMRDYWCNNKEQFNKALLNHVAIHGKDYFEFNDKEYAEPMMGKDKKLHAKSWVPSHPIARWMMNAKPDIGIVTEKQGLYKLSFIECKYLSNESTYKYEGVKDTSQSKLQCEILEFICNTLEAKYNEKPLKKGKVSVVRFINSNAEENEEISVHVKDLLM